MPLFLVQQPRCVFAHIPKTGGHSIRNVYFERRFEGPIFVDALPEEWQEEFSFAFVRNPFDRLVSAWIMFSQGTQDDAWNLPEGGVLDLTLEQVLRLAMDERTEFGHPRYNKIKPTALTRLKNHVIPQTHPYHGIQHVGFIGRFENLQQDFQTVIAPRLGLQEAILPHTNTTRHEHYRNYFDKTTRDLATRYYAEDLERFGYEF